jgi:L-rhamnose mutarotase
MQRVAFKMRLYKGNEEEYRKRHDEIPVELKKLLAAAGISEYSIFLDHATGDLFAFMKVEDEEMVRDLADELVMKDWWMKMKDIMQTNDDHSPVTIPLTEVFYLP